MKRLLLGCTAVLACAPLLAASNPGEWPSWRGADGSGSVSGGRYPTRWSPEQVAWKVALPGKGVSTPIVWKDRIYLTTPADGEDGLMALDSSGRQLWLAKLGPESAPRHRTLASSCNSSPVTDGKAIFARFRSGRVAAIEMDGRIRWQINLHERYGPEQVYWDQGSSPVVTDQHVIISRLHQGESWVGGFDKQTGAERWIQKRNYQVPPENDNGYTTPVFFKHQGKPAFLVWGSDHVTAHSAVDGKLLWSCGGFNPTGMKNWPAIANPVLHQGLAIIPVGRDDRPGQARVHAIRLDGSGDVTQSHRVWQRDDVGVFCSSPVEYRGRIYLLRHRGGVVCLDPATGKTVWEEAFPRGSASYYSSPVVAGGILYAAREDGTVFAARVGERFELLSENPMGERIVASPVPGKDFLLIRGEKTLFCLRP